MKFNEFRVAMEHNKILCRFVPWLRKTILVRIIHRKQGYYGMDRNRDKIEKFNICYNENQSKFEKVYSILSDDESKRTYDAVIEFRKTYDYECLRKNIYYPQYFVKEIFNEYKNEVYVDGGAYTGDTIFSLLRYVPSGDIEKIYAWEPDEGNGKTLLNEVNKALKKIGNVVVEWIPCALYKEETTLYFSNTSNGCSNIYDGEISIKADTIDNRCSDATFIKMDIEGAEIDALYGAKNTIITNKPKLAICIYHSNEHLYEIPLLIHEWVPEYKLYIRHHGELAAETVLYATI